MKNLNDFSIQYVKGVGPAKKKLLMALGIETVEDILYFFPRRYEDRRNLTPIAQIQVGQCQTITGTILNKFSRKSWHTRKHLTEIVLDDGGGRVSCTWFNQPYLENYFHPGKKMVCYGRVDIYKNKIQMVSPEYEIIEGEDEALSLKCIVPIYSLTRGVTQRFLRKLIKSCLEHYGQQLQDELPVSLRNHYKLANIKRSIHNIHFPEDFKDQEEALRRVSFEEFYFFQISIILRRLSITQKKGIAHSIKDAQALNFISAFSFELTKAQKKVVQEIREDMQRNIPMLRLLQGDVGSGKTLVALFGCVAAVQNGYQSCIMAPTAILARQHYENIQKMLGGSSQFKEVKPALLLSNMKKGEKDLLYRQIQEGEVNLVVGTHALISEDTRFKNISFVVVDEQHKFGVRQRALLSQKGNNPDVLIMTATPIPRTLCITLYGDLDASIIDELPPGRGRVETALYSLEQDKEVYDIVIAKVKKGRQAYIVYPIIEESEKLDLKAAQVMFHHFQKHEFKGFQIALVHGQMKSKESQEIMEKFKSGEIDILVSTTVLEVGVDVPNSSVMVVEHAERFGLAQLHQLRGRIGRGKEDGLCLLIGDPQTEEGRARLDAICSTTNGFKIAQKDLEIRGPGHFFGRHQHGLNELKVANPATQLDILEIARKEAIAITKDDPELNKEQNYRIKEVIQRRYPTYLSMVEAG